MSTLGRWLADVLNRHIERHNVPAESVAVELTIDTTRFDQALRAALASAETALTPVGVATQQIVAALAATTKNPRPCWACGDPAGFHGEHLPCWDDAALHPPKAAPLLPTPPEARPPRIRTYGDWGGTSATTLPISDGSGM